MQRGTTVYNVYPVSNYTFGTKPNKPDKDSSIPERLNRLRANFERDGMRRTVEAMLVVQEHNHPHVLMFQLGPNVFRLPGGRLRAGEDEVEGLRRKLSNNLAPENAALQVVWDVGEVAGVFWRPNFDTIVYPYMPPHITKPKECRKLFMVQLPSSCVFAVPRNMKLVAVPLFDLYDNAPRYGPLISSIPVLLGRFRLNVQQAPNPTLQYASSSATQNGTLVKQEYMVH